MFDPADQTRKLFDADGVPGASRRKLVPNFLVSILMPSSGRTGLQQVPEIAARLRGRRGSARQAR
jgi:hypothetical protein